MALDAYAHECLSEKTIASLEHHFQTGMSISSPSAIDPCRLV
ncbi:family 9 glycosyl transferase [Neisseria wadsworthii 9715]|uniref:Family 9 glycosyl transferase n=1 Tax=Neisseria wadsworthii 9715 TaxID=1030841 RepID=G4CMW0_9NEIS|nr:family 9 glycosyl transferase [Neisseria wadsworthii 9715]